MIRNWLRNFMIGRYGPDQLNIACLVISFVFAVVTSFTGLLVFWIIEYAFLFYGMFRFLSRNIEKRRRENDRFLRFWWPIRRKLKISVERIKSRKNYKFFKCPSCANMLRVPRNKGKISITCPKCGERFSRKT